jgi:hypothetical protein
MMSVDDTLMCSFQILKPADKKAPGANPNNRYQLSPGVAPLVYSSGGGPTGAAGAAGASGGPGSQRPSTPPKGGPPQKAVASGPKK